MDASRQTRLVKGARAATYVAVTWVTINLVILLVGFFLKLFGANAEAGFTEFWYRNLDRVMEPFRGIFPSAELGTTGDVQTVLDVSILFAMVVYAIVYVLINALIDWLNHRAARAAELAAPAPGTTSYTA